MHDPAEESYRARRAATFPGPAPGPDGQHALQAMLGRLAGASFGKGCFVAPDARVFTSRLHMGEAGRIASGALLAGEIEMGDGCSIGPDARLLGRVVLGHGCRIEGLASLQGCAVEDPASAGRGVTLGDGVRIGAGAIVADGVTIGARATVQAGAVVTRDVPPAQVVAGNPARPVAELPASELPAGQIPVSGHPHGEHPIGGRPAPAAPHQGTDGQGAGRPGRVRKLLHDGDPYADLQIAYPQDMQGWGSKDPIFRKLLLERRPKFIVEVGSWKGASAIHMADICRDAGIEAEIVCVDTWLGNWQHWKRREGVGSRADLRMRNGYPTLYFQFLSNVVAAGHQDRITPLALTGIAAAKLFAAYGLRPDLIYIDGDHEYESVIGDLRGWLPLLAEGGMLLGDDYDFAGVRTAFEEMAADPALAGEVRGKKFLFRRSTA